jgi:hypothetical protein
MPITTSAANVKKRVLCVWAERRRSASMSPFTVAGYITSLVTIGPEGYDDRRLARGDCVMTAKAA